MPYDSTCNCAICNEARRMYGARLNQENYVRATESGATTHEARAYVARFAGYVEAQPPAAWLSEHRCAPTMTDDDEAPDYGIDEEPISDTLRTLTFDPLARILRRGGRYWSTEVEINGISSYTAATILGAEQDGYTYKATEAGTIIATDDCTCDAEIKIGRMRDGATMTRRARATYDTLRENGAGCGFNTGHHVHVDASRIVNDGIDTVEAVLQASLTLASACNPTLVALASSGYPSHRDPNGSNYAGSLKHGDALRNRTAWHASNARYVAQNGDGYGIPTFEYRLPNGTTEPIRAHAHIAVALGLLDYGERCHDGDTEAQMILGQAQDRVSHAGDWSEADGAAILSRALHLHPDSLRALAIAAETGPANKQTTNAFALSA